MQFSGSISQSGQVVLPHVSGTLNVQHTAGGFETWTGEFAMSAGSGIAIGDYELILSDGREADILVLGIRSGSHRRTVVRFSLNGGFR